MAIQVAPLHDPVMESVSRNLAILTALLHTTGLIDASTSTEGEDVAEEELKTAQELV